MDDQAPLVHPVISESGPLPVRALSIPEQLDATIRQVRANLWFMLAPVFGILTPIVLIEGALGIRHAYSLTGVFESSQGGFFGSSGIFQSPSSFFLWSVFNGVTVPLVSLWLMYNAHRHLVGLHTTVTPPWRLLGKTYLTWLVTQGIVWGPILLFAFFASGLVGQANRSGDLSGVSPLFFGLAVMMAILYPLWMFWQAITFLAPGLTIVEGHRPLQALVKSVRLFKNNWGIVLGASITLSIAIGITSSVLASVPTLLLVIPNDYLWATEGIAIVLSHGVTLPLSTMATMILVRDVLIRAEGADLTHRIAHLTGRPRPIVASTPGVDWGQGDS